MKPIEQHFCAGCAAAKTTQRSGLCNRLIARVFRFACILLLAGCANHSARRAAYLGDLGGVKTAVAKGANVNESAEKEGTPLHQAVLGNRLEVAEWLLANGANPDARTQSGLTPLHDAVRNEQRLEMAKLLLNHGAKVGAKDVYGETPLHIAACFGQRAAVELLLANGADPNEVRNDGRSALHSAVSMNSTGTVKLLVAKGADVNGTFAGGLTPLHLAVEKCFLLGMPPTITPVIELLLIGGAQPRAVTKTASGFATADLMTAGSFKICAEHLERSGSSDPVAISYYEKAASLYDKLPKSILMKVASRDPAASQALLSGLESTLLSAGQYAQYGSLVGMEGALLQSGVSKELETFGKKLATECRASAQRLIVKAASPSTSKP